MERVVFKLFYFFIVGTMDVDALRRLVDPRDRGVPRRAALDATGLVIHATTDIPEIDVVSDMCHAIFGAELEPRDAPKLIDRAFLWNIPTAWRALRDDCIANRVPDHVWGLVSSDRMLDALYRPIDESVIVVCAHILSRIDVALDVTSPEIWCDIARALAPCSAGRYVMNHLDPSTRDVAHMLLEAPEVATLFLGSTGVAAMRADARVVESLVARAASLRPQDRYEPLALLACGAAAGVRIDPQIGVATLVDLRRRAFDAKVAAAAAVVAQGHDDAVIRGMASVVESLASAVQGKQ